jgi:O-antigen/teichoic acid export membrane protein
MSKEAPAHRPGTVAQGVAYLSVSYAAVLVLGFAVHALASRRLGEGDYGRLVVAISAGTWLKVLAAALFVPGLAKIVSEDHRRLGAALSAGGRWHLRAALALMAAFAAASPLVARVLGDRALTALLALSALEAFLICRLVLRSYLLQALRRYKDAAAASATYGVFRAGGAGILLLLGLGAAGAMAGLSAGPLVAGGVATALLWRALRRLPAEPYPALWPRSLRWTAMMLPADMATATLMGLDLWIVKGVVPDPAAAGLYGAAFAVSRLADTVAQGVSSAVFARVSGALAAGQRALARSVSAEAMRFLLIVLAPVCFLAAGSGRQIMGLLFGAPYADAGRLLALLVTAVSCLAGMKLMLILLTAADRPAHKSLLVLGLLPVGAALCLWLTHRLGPVGAAVGSLTTMAAGLLVAGALVYHRVGVYPPPLAALRCGLAGGAAYALGLLWPAAGLLVVPKLGALTLLYLALLFVTRELGPDELRSLWRAVLPGGSAS